MSARQRALLYVLFAIPLFVGALVLRLSGNGSGHHGVRAVSHQRTPEDLQNTAYLAKVNRICDAATRFGASLPVPGKSVAAYERVLHRANIHTASVIRQVGSVDPPSWFLPWHQLLIRLARTELTNFRDADHALAVRNRAATRAAFQRGEASSRALNQLAAAMGLLYCVSPPQTSARLAYPRAPKRHGRTLLSWTAFDHAIDGICADNSARTVYGERLARGFRKFDEAERNTGLWRLDDTSYRRLYTLIRRLGRPPDDRRPTFDQWLVRVRERAAVMHQEFVADFTQQPAKVHRLEAVFSRLSAEENWLGAHFGLRVCSRNGPARPPAASSS